MKRLNRKSMVPMTTTQISTLPVMSFTWRTPHWATLHHRRAARQQARHGSCIVAMRTRTWDSADLTHPFGAMGIRWIVRASQGRSTPLSGADQAGVHQIRLHIDAIEALHLIKSLEGALAARPRGHVTQALRAGGALGGGHQSHIARPRDDQMLVSARAGQRRQVGEVAVALAGRRRLAGFADVRGAGHRIDEFV